MSGIARIHFGIIAILLLLGAYAYATWPQSEESYHTAVSSTYCTNKSVDVQLLAKAGYAEDLKTGAVIYEKNSDVQLPLASITKLMTVLVAHDTLTSNDLVTITAEATKPEGTDVAVGEVWKAEDLMDYTLITSSNDGAHALALASAKKRGETYDGFLTAMNAKASAIGLSQAYFANDTGLDVSVSSAGAYGSARDAARLLAYAVERYPRLMERSVSGRTEFTPVAGETHIAKNTSGFIGSLPGAIASKTGFTDLAGGNLTIVYEPVPGRPLALAVMGSTREGRDADMATLSKAAKKYVTRDILCESLRKGS